MNRSNSLATTRVKTAKNERHSKAGRIWLAAIATVIIGLCATIWCVGTNAMGYSNGAGALSTLSDVDKAEWGYFQDQHRYASLAQLRTAYRGDYSLPSYESDYRFRIVVNPGGKSYYAVAEPVPVTIWGIQVAFLCGIQPRVYYIDEKGKEFHAPFGAMIPPGGFHGHPPAGSPWTPEA